MTVKHSAGKIKEILQIGVLTFIPSWNIGHIFLFDIIEIIYYIYNRFNIVARQYEFRF